MNQENKYKAALYVRVSTHHQIDKDSLPFQRNELVNYARYALNIEDVVIFEDAGYSAKNTDRPMYQQMMKRIRQGEFSHLLVWKIDRISRNLKDFTSMYEELKDRKITFISKNEQFDTSTAMGEAMLKIILVFAELERELTAERVYSIMLSRAEKGLWNGATVPIGFKWSEEKKYPVIDSNEAKIVQHIFDLYEKEASTLEVAYRFNEEGIPTKRGGTWTPKTIRDVLRNPFYIGTYRYNVRERGSGTKNKKESEWIVLENNHPAIISKDQFNKVNKMLTENYKGNTHVKRTDIHTHMFAGMLYCQECNNILYAGLDNPRKDGYRPSRYTCTTSYKIRPQDRCESFTSDINITPFVLTYISNLIRLQERFTPNHTKRDIERALLRGSPFIDVVGINDEALQDTIFLFQSSKDAELFTSKQPRNNTTSFEGGKLKKEITTYKNALERLNELYLFDDAGMSKKEYILQKKEIEKKLKTVESKFQEIQLETQRDPSDSIIDKAPYFIITKMLLQTINIDYRGLIDIVGKELITVFLKSVIQRIEVSNKQVQSITFRNGVIHQFAWKEYKKQQNRVSQRGAYKTFIPDVMKFVEENGSINRREVEALTNLKRSSASSLLLHLENQNKLERRGHSVATRFYKTQKEC